MTLQVVTMGRKPNALIVEYFHRGAKIADASNRYEHTCKRCGEQFPKGRIDSLTAHLTKKCIGLTMPERTKIVLRLHDLADPTANPELNNGLRDGNQVEAGNTLDLPFTPTKQQNFNALNVLAEASRRVGGDGPVASGYTAAEQAHPHDHAQPLPLDPQLEIDSFAQHLLESPDDGLSGRNNGKLQPFFHFAFLFDFSDTRSWTVSTSTIQHKNQIRIYWFSSSARLCTHLVMPLLSLSFLILASVDIYYLTSNPESRLSCHYCRKSPTSIFVHDKWSCGVSR